MPEQRGTATDRLADIIQMVLIAQQTGILQVERGAGETLEQGAITFATGQVVDAKTGDRSGAEALNWLRTWGRCRFVFIHKPLDEIVPPTPKTGRGAKIKSENIIKHLLPLPNKDVPPAFIQNPTPPPPPPPAPSTHPPAPSMRNEPVRFNSASSPPSAPYRLHEGNHVMTTMERMGFSRMHRHVFLLIDGQRTVKDLAWLTKRSIPEIQQLLSELEHAGLIRQ